MNPNLIVALIVLNILLQGNVLASGQSPSTFETQLEQERARRIDAAEYSRTNAVEIAEAEQRLEVEALMAPTIRNLRKEFASRLAGIYVEHEPYERIVVRLTGNEPVFPRVQVAGSTTFKTEFLLGAHLSLSEAKAILEKKFGALISQVSRNAGCLR